MTVTRRPPRRRPSRYGGWLEVSIGPARSPRNGSRPLLTRSGPRRSG
jgi:hypothetical protein